MRLILILTLLIYTAHAQALSTCVITASPIVFGAYDSTSNTALNANGNIAVTCTLNTALPETVTYTLKFNTGNSGNYANRALSNLGNLLYYNIFTNAAYSSVWGDGTAGSSVVSDSYTINTTPITKNYPSFGRIPAAQNIPVGNYSDVIFTTITY